MLAFQAAHPVLYAIALCCVYIEAMLISMAMRR
jgi:hypothetical protein